MDITISFTDDEAPVEFKDVDNAGITDGMYAVMSMEDGVTSTFVFPIHRVKCVTEKTKGLPRVAKAS